MLFSGVNATLFALEKRKQMLGQWRKTDLLERQHEVEMQYRKMAEGVDRPESAKLGLERE